MDESTSALKKRIEELEEMHRLSQSLSSVINVYETIEAVAESCLKLCHAERSAILLFSGAPDDPARTVVRSTTGMEHEIDHRVNSMVVAWMERHKKPLLTEDVLETLNLKNQGPSLQQLGPCLAVPLVADDKVFGVMNLINSRGGIPFSKDSLRIANLLAPLAARFIERARVQESLFEANVRLNTALHQRYSISSIVGKSRAMEEIIKKIPILASSTSNVLVTGETGTGKGLVARAIHFTGSRAEKPFIAVNCAAVPREHFESELFGPDPGASTGSTEKKGKFELAGEGTIFLDEISALPVELQPKLLRMLEERSSSPVESSVGINAGVRIIAGSTKNLQEAVRTGGFRDDLYHRLNVVPIHLPPLRDRIEDVPLLAWKFLQEFSGEAKRFSPDALEMISSMEWKGNVRELRNVVERISMFAASPDITTQDLQKLGISHA